MLYIVSIKTGRYVSFETTRMRSARYTEDRSNARTFAEMRDAKAFMGADVKHEILDIEEGE